MSRITWQPSSLAGRNRLTRIHGLVRWFSTRIPLPSIENHLVHTWLEPHLIPAVHHVPSRIPFLFLSYFRSLHCYPTPNLFRPFFSPIKRRPQTKLLPTTFQLSTYDPRALDVFRRVVLRSRKSGSHATRNVTGARRFVADIQSNGKFLWDKLLLILKINIENSGKSRITIDSLED